MNDREVLHRAGEIAAEMEALDDARDELLSDILRRAKLIGKVMSWGHGTALFRTTGDYPHYVSNDDEKVVFEIIDSYDNSHSGSYSLTFQQLSDPDKAIETLKAQKKKVEREKAKRKLHEAQEQLRALS